MHSMKSKLCRQYVAVFALPVRQTAFVSIHLFYFQSQQNRDCIFLQYFYHHNLCQEYYYSLPNYHDWLYHGITNHGNWEENNNIPDINYGDKNIAKKYNLDSADFENKINELKQKLFDARAKRIRPHTDDKVLTSWNALMAKGFI